MRRTSMNLDLGLVAAAKNELGTSTTTETVHAALREVVARARVGRLLAVRFDEVEDPAALDRARRDWWEQ